MSLDLDNMYFHIRLHPSMYQFFGFKLLDEGKPRYFFSKVMFYGTRSAVYVVTTVLKPLKGLCHLLFIKYCCFIDDSRIVHKNEVACQYQFELVKLLYNLCGWKVNLKKSSTKPEQCLYYLGFYIDSVSLNYFAHPEKIKFLLYGDIL